MKKTIFLTGAAGMVGIEIAKTILTETDHDLICLLHTNGKRMEKNEFLSYIFDNKLTEINSKYISRVEVLLGDITQENLGLSPNILTSIFPIITGIIHSAGSTNFSLSLEESRKWNVLGTQNTVCFAAKCQNDVSFAYISTVFVAGKKTGDIFEDNSDISNKFVNSYEQSKFEAETFLLKEQTSVNVSIYRLSTVLGNSLTGEVRKFIAPHQMMRLMYLGMVSMMPGQKEYPVDLIAVDHAAQAITKLFTEYFNPGEIFHIAAGLEHSYPLQDMIDDTFIFFEKNIVGWQEKLIPQPLLVTRESFELFLNSVEETKNPFMLQIVHNTKYFAEQLLYPKNYQKHNTLRNLPDFDRTLPDIREFYSKVLKYCLITHWGKNST